MKKVLCLIMACVLMLSVCRPLYVYADETEATDAPATSEPDNTAPEETIPGETVPDGTDPGNPDPDGTDPDATDPDGTDPDGTDPDGTDPDGTDPDGTDPDGTDPDGTDPGGTDPDGTNPDGTDPDGTNPDGTDPDGTNPDGTDPGDTPPEDIPPSIDEMKSSQAFVDILKHREGFSKYPYKDNSQWSIGYGTKCPDDKLSYYKKHGITEAEAEKLMYEMLEKFEQAVIKYAKKYELTFTQNQFDALVSFTYNCGDSWTRETSGNLNRAVREGWTGSDFLYAICLWSKSDGEFILINRRLYEANMYVNGIYEKSYNHETGNFRYVYLEAGQGTLSYIIHGYDITDPKPIRYSFKTLPKGIDKQGNPFTYEFAGWYTAPENGNLVEVLDSNLTSATVLHAMWKDSEGNLVYLPKGQPCEEIVITTTESVSIRLGPGTYYAKDGKLKESTTVKLTSICVDGKITWGQFAGGWINLAYTDYEKVITEMEGWPKTGKVNANNVNIRSGAGTSYAVQYQLAKDTPVTVYRQEQGNGLDWGMLEDGNWICLTYVTFDPVPEIPPETDPEIPPETDPDVPPEVDPDIPPETDPDVPPEVDPDIPPDTDPDVPPEPDPDVPPETDPEVPPVIEPELYPAHKDATVQGTNVNVRSGPDRTYTVVYQRNTGDRVTVVGQATVGDLIWGKLDDGNWICLDYVIFDDATETEPEEAQSADVDGDGKIDKDDAIYLLRHVVYPDKYPANVKCDADGNGVIDKDDAIYLLRHVVYPDKYPLKFGE